MTDGSRSGDIRKQPKSSSLCAFLKLKQRPGARYGVSHLSPWPRGEDEGEGFEPIRCRLALSALNKPSPSPLPYEGRGDISIRYPKGGSKHRLFGSTVKSYRCAIAVKSIGSEIPAMKKIKLLN